MRLEHLGALVDAESGEVGERGGQRIEVVRLLADMNRRDAHPCSPAGLRNGYHPAGG